MHNCEIIINKLIIGTMIPIMTLHYQYLHYFNKKITHQFHKSCKLNYTIYMIPSFHIINKNEQKELFSRPQLCHITLIYFF